MSETVDNLKTSLNMEEILKYLPHRYPFLLVDKVESYEPGKNIIAYKNVTMNEHFFVGHFPEKPVMPGVLIIEALAQAGGILAYKSTEWVPEDTLLYFASIENVRFKKVVLPGDVLQLHVEVTKKRSMVWKFTGTARVDGEIVCTSDMTSVVRNRSE